MKAYEAGAIIPVSIEGINKAMSECKERIDELESKNKRLKKKLKKAKKTCCDPYWITRPEIKP